VLTTILRGIKRLTRSTNPHLPALTWLNAVLNAAAQKEYETICLQPDDTGAIHALVAGPFRPDSDIHDGMGGFRLDVETPGLFILHSEGIPFDAPCLAEPLPPQHIESLFTILYRCSGRAKVVSSMMESFLLDEGISPPGTRISAYVHQVNGKRLVKFDIRHDTLDITAWLDALILEAYERNVYAPEIRTSGDPDHIYGIFTCCNDDGHGTFFDPRVNKRLLPTVVQVLERGIGHQFTPHRHHGSFKRSIEGSLFKIDVYDHRDPSGYDSMLKKKPGFTLLIKKQDTEPDASTRETPSGSWCEGCT
jgi:hypothetical protein